MWLCLLLKLGLPEQAVGWFPLRFGLVVEDKPILNFHAANCGLLSLSAADNISTPSVMHSGLPIEGSVANLSCPPEMILSGTNTTTCTRNGVWEPNPQNVNCVAGLVYACIHMLV